MARGGERKESAQSWHEIRAAMANNAPSSEFTVAALNRFGQNFKAVVAKLLKLEGLDG